MTTRYIQRYALVCDGCSTEHAPVEGFESAIEARASAYGEGWRFPHRRTKTGKQTSRTSDVCPRCWPTWEPTPDSSKSA